MALIRDMALPWRSHGASCEKVSSTLQEKHFSAMALLHDMALPWRAHGACMAPFM